MAVVQKLGMYPAPGCRRHHRHSALAQQTLPFYFASKENSMQSAWSRTSQEPHADWQEEKVQRKERHLWKRYDSVSLADKARKVKQPKTSPAGTKQEMVHSRDPNKC